MLFYTYILHSSAKDKYYVGSCENIEIRLALHNAGRNKSTKFGIPWIVKKIETFSTRAEATQRETHIKKMKSRKFIELVILGER